MNVKVFGFLIGLLVMMSSFLPVTFASKNSQPLIMNDAGQPIKFDMSQFGAVVKLPPSNLRLAIFDGSEWMEVPFQIDNTPPIMGSVTNSSSSSLPMQSPSIQEPGGSSLTFLMPQLVGQVAAEASWWSIATELKMNSRLSFVIADSVGHQSTLYLYFRTTGLAPSPTFQGLAIVNANSPLLNGTNLVTPTQVAPTFTSPLSTSPVQTSSAPSSGGDPTVYAHLDVNTPDPATISYPNPGSADHGPVNYNVEVPVSRSYGHLTISDASYGDGYLRYLQLYVNSHAVFSDNSGQGKIVAGGEYFDVDVSSLLIDGINSIGVYISTYCPNPTYCPNGYWTFSSKLNVAYGASKFITNSEDWFSTMYEFRNTASNILTFSSMVPNGVSQAVMTVLGYSYNECCARFFHAYIGGTEVTPSGGVIVPNTGFTWTSSDLTNYVAYKLNVKIGITITTYCCASPNTNAFWRVWGLMGYKARFQVWPDGDSRWGKTIHPFGKAATSLYDISNGNSGDLTPNGVGIYPNHFIAAPSMEIQSKEATGQGFVMVYLGLMTHVPSWVESDYSKVMNVQGQAWGGIWITHKLYVTVTPLTTFPNGQLGQSQFPVVNGYASPNPNCNGVSTCDQGSHIGADLLTIISIVSAVLGYPEISVPASLAAVFVNYLTPQPVSTFTQGVDSSGQVYLTDTRGLSQAIYDDLSDTLTFQVDFPTTGIYIFSMTDVITVTADWSIKNILTGQWHTVETQLNQVSLGWSGWYTNQ